MYQEHDAPEYRLISAKIVTGRKTHHCGRCGEEIPAGAKHWTHSYVEDGKFHSERCHGSDYLECPKFLAQERAEEAAWAEKYPYPSEPMTVGKSA